MYDLLKKNSAFFFPYLLFLLIATSCLTLWGRNDISLFINGHNSFATDFFFQILDRCWLRVPNTPRGICAGIYKFQVYDHVSCLFFGSFWYKRQYKVCFTCPTPIYSIWASTPGFLSCTRCRCLYLG